MRARRWSRPRRALAAAAASIACLLGPAAGTAGATVVALEPGDDFCAAVRAVEPGMELVLAPGDYPASCSIRGGGEPGAPVIIRGADPERPARIVHTRTDANVLEIRASHVVLRGLAFGPTPLNIDAVRIRSGRDIAIEDCVFTQVRGIPIVANHSARDVAIRRNRVYDSNSTAIYFGCQDGADCEVLDVVVESNYVLRTGASQSAVGYGVEIKLNSTAIVRDNVFVDTRGPGVMIYGARDLQRTSIVEGNFIHGSRSSGILLGGGPAVVRNNIAVGAAKGGIGLQDYGGRALLRGITIAHNTLHGNPGGGVVVFGPLRGVNVINNAIQARGVPSPRAGLRTAGNIECSTAIPCFEDPAAMNFSPSAILMGMGAMDSDVWMPEVDYLGIRRGPLPTVGAIERPGAGPIPDAPKGVVASSP